MADEIIYRSPWPAPAGGGSTASMPEAPQLKQQGPYDRELGIFMALMRMKMEKNAHRGRWQDGTFDKALAGLKRELTELEEAIQRGDVADILLEAADVANFAMIAAFVAMENKRG